MQVLENAIATGLGGAAALVALFAILHSASWLYNRFRFRKSFLFVFHPTAFGVDTPPEGDQHATGLRATDLLAKVSEYIGADPRGSVAPGALESSAPSASAEELSTPSGLAATFLALVRAQRPSYHVHITRLDGHGSGTAQAEPGAGAPNQPPGPPAVAVRVAVTIVKQPGSQFITSHTMAVTAAVTTRRQFPLGRVRRADPPDLVEEAVEAVGAFCLQQVHNQRSVARLAPRWERWHSADAYRYYRKGLDIRDRALRLLTLECQERGRQRLAADGQRRGDLKIEEEGSWGPALDEAVEWFGRASLADPGNVLPRQAQAAALELRGKFRPARQVYTSCRAIWPEQIEQVYRLAVYGQDELHNPRELYLEARNRLRWIRLARRWLGTWLPWRVQPGERRYWASFLRPSHPHASRLARPTRRQEFLGGLGVALFAVELRDRVEEGAPGDERDVAKLLGSVARRVGQRPWPGRTGKVRFQAPRPTFRGARRRRAARRTGWLAHWNAACAYSLAIELPADQRPWRYSAEDWAADCAEAALHELNQVLRDPYNQLDLSWLYTDDDLAALTRVVTSRPDLTKYAAYVALLGRPSMAPSTHAARRDDPTTAAPKRRALRRIERRLLSWR